MKNVLLIALSFFFAAGSATAQDMESRTYFFPVNGSNFTYSMSKELKNFIQSLDTLEKVEIYGFCDSTGSITINEKLSLRRAESARTQLIKNGVSKEMISVKGFGEKAPISEKVPNYDFNHNRKVEIVFYVKWDPANDAEILFDKLENDGNQFTIRPQFDTALVTDNGSMIVIAKNSFKTNSKENITLQVKEFFDKSQIVSNNLSTTAEGKILSQGMMIEVIALQNGDTLEKNLTIPMQFSFLNNDLREGMKTFHGMKTSAGFVDWYQNTEAGPVFESRGAALKGPLPGVTLPTDTLINPRSIHCDTLKEIEDKDLVANFNIFQKIFWSKNKKQIEIDRLAAIKAERDSCTACYSAFKNQEMAKKARKMNIMNIIKAAQIENNAKFLANESDINLKESNYYVFSSTKTGLLSVDDYQQFNKNTIDIVVTDCNQSINAKLVFQNSKIMIPAKKTKNGFIFEKIPNGEEVTIFAVKYKDKKIGFYNESFTTDIKNMKFYMDFKDATLSDVKKEFLKLDSQSEKTGCNKNL